MIARVNSYIQDHNMIKSGDALILAVSGGPDSMVLLDLLCRLRPELNFTVIAAHLHHGLRPEADAEQILVEQRCAHYGVELVVQRQNIKAMAKRDGLSLEDAGRRARYAFFQELRQERSAATIATAHHFNDRVESVLLHLLRGSGIAGLRGIMPVNREVIRPLLACRRDEIMAYLKALKLPYALDASNQDPHYTRNRIRHELLPELRANYNPAIDDTLSRLADLAVEEEAFLNQLCRKATPQVVIEQAEGYIAIDVERLVAMEYALQRRVMHFLLKEILLADWSYQDVENLLALSRKSGSTHRLSLQKGIQARLSYGILILSQLEEKVPEPFYLEFNVPGKIQLADGRCWELTRVSAEEWSGQNEILALDEDKLNWPLCLRSRQPGDRFHPPGMLGSKKIKDLFIDMKIPQSERTAWPLLASINGEIYALPGKGASRLALPDHFTNRLLLIRAIRGEPFTR